MKTHKIAPSLLASDFGKLNEEVAMLNVSEADWLHLDIMDGVFVPNISFGLPVVQAVAKVATKPLDVHLMIVQPEKYLAAFANAGAATITVHFEACVHLHRTIQEIKSLGCKAGVALNPHTPVTVLEDILEELDLVCLMSVNPGFGGQTFIERTYEKIYRLDELRHTLNSHLLIEIDGGVSAENAKKLIEHGADVLVAGSCVFGSENPSETISALKKLT